MVTDIIQRMRYKIIISKRVFPLGESAMVRSLADSLAE